MQSKRNNTVDVNPLISIIVPIYNVEKYLPVCIDSICNQTYQNIEIILVDDGSTDGCGKICDEYSKKDDRIRVIHKANAGLGQARNSGIEIARGDLLGFIDSDDAIFPQMFEVLFYSMRQTGAQISACTRMKIGEDGNVPDKQFNIQEEIRQIESFSGRDSVKELLQSHKKFKNAVWEKLYRRELFDNIRFRSVYAEDREVMYQLLYACEKVAYIGLPLVCYRQRTGSTMLSKWNDHKDNMVYEQNEQCLSFFKEKKDKELCDAAIYWHILVGIENYRRLEGQDTKYRKRLKKEIIPYTKAADLFQTDYPLRRKIEFWVFGKVPSLHYRICNGVRAFKKWRGSI